MIHDELDAAIDRGLRRARLIAVIGVVMGVLGILLALMSFAHADGYGDGDGDGYRYLDGRHHHYFYDPRDIPPPTPYATPGCVTAWDWRFGFTVCVQPYKLYPYAPYSPYGPPPYWPSPY